MFINAVLTLSINVNKTTDTPSEPVTTTAFLMFCLSPTEPPTITGKSEIVHGASTVNNPATKDNIKSIIQT